jgi:hypothetical protein
MEKAFPAFFNPENCRNKSEVESKFIVYYLLPALGYPPDSWHQEVTFGRNRLDFLAMPTRRGKCLAYCPRKLVGSPKDVRIGKTKFPSC